MEKEWMPKSSSNISTPAVRGTWLITEAEREGDDWRLFGYCHIYEWEWGYLMLSSWHLFVCRSDLPSNATFTRPGNTSGIFCRRMNDGKGLGILLPLADKQNHYTKRTINMATFEEKAERLKKELEEATNDDQRRNLSREYELTLRLLRIIRGEVFTLDDINKCRMEIMRLYPGYDRPITAESGILLAAEAIRKSFGKKYYLPLYKYPILIDFGTRMGRYA